MQFGGIINLSGSLVGATEMGRLICVAFLSPLAKLAINFSGRQWQNVVTNEV